MRPTASVSSTGCAVPRPISTPFRGKTFVVGFGGEVAEGERLEKLCYDCNLLGALGVRLRAGPRGSTRRSRRNWNGASSRQSCTTGYGSPTPRRSNASRRRSGVCRIEIEACPFPGPAQHADGRFLDAGDRGQLHHRQADRRRRWDRLPVHGDRAQGDRRRDHRRPGPAERRADLAAGRLALRRDLQTSRWRKPPKRSRSRCRPRS